MEAIRFPGKPYIVTYRDFHTNELIRIKRRPPAANHAMLPTDKVELKVTKNDDWREGDTDTIKHISYRNPNILQIENEDGLTTFMRSDELELKEKVADRGDSHFDDYGRNRYLTWP